MSATGKQIVATLLGTSVANLYTATAITRIDAVTLTNPSGSAVTVDLYLTPSGSSGTSTQVLSAKSLAAGASYIVREAIGHWLPNGGTIAAKASTVAVVALVASGVTIS